MRRSILLVACALGLVVLATGVLSAREPPKQEAAAAPEQPQTSPAPAAEQEPAAKEEEGEEEEFKEEEPATPAEKLKKEELEKRACPVVDVKFSADTDKKSHPTPEPSPGKALVYVVRATMMGHKIQSKLAVDAKWAGVNRGNNYFFLELDPGEHYFCSKAENRSAMALKVEAGKTYFVEQKIKMGFLKARNQLAVVSDDVGKKKLAKCHPSSWQEKK